LVYDKQSNPFSMGIKCPGRVWKLQCDTESDRDEWVQALRTLLQDPLHTGYIPDCNAIGDASNHPVANGPMNGATASSNQNAKSSAMKSGSNSMKIRNEKDREQMKADAEMKYTQQLDIEKERILQLKAKTEELKTELTKIERQRDAQHTEHEQKVSALNKEIESLKSKNVEQDKEIKTKDALISKTQDAVKEMTAAINQLQRESEEQQQRIHALHDVLYKVQGESVLKLKYGKMSRKEVVFVSGINQLFYYDEGGNSKAEQKYIKVLSVQAKSETIKKNMDKHWFLVTGEKRVALFATDDAATQSKWVKFMKESLGSGATMHGKTPSMYNLANGDDDEKKGDE